MLRYDLRDYQEVGVSSAVEAFKVDAPFLLVAATGAGKSLIIAEICHRLNKKVLILCPSKEILTQNYEKLLSYGIDDIGIYSASAGRKDIGKYTYAMIGSVVNKSELFADVDYIIIDEADLAPMDKKTSMYRRFLKDIPTKKICGLTATPYRIEQKYIHEYGQIYYTSTLQLLTNIGKPRYWSGGIVFNIESRELINRGYLSPIKYREDSQDLHELVVNSTGNDYTEKSLQRWSERKVSRIADYVAFVHEQAKRNIVFVNSVATAEAVQVNLRARGVQSHVISAKTPPKERDELLIDFKTGKVKHMINVGVFLAGLDVPEINSVIFARPTISVRVWYQAVGRGVRLDPADPKKTLRVFDLSGTIAKVGRVETIKIYDNHLFSEQGQLDDKSLFKFLVKKKVVWT